MLNKKRTVVLVLLLLLISGSKVFSSPGIIQKENVYYYSNYVTVKFKSLPVFTAGLPVVSEGLAKYLESIKANNSIPFVKNSIKNSSAMDRVFYLQYNSSTDPYYVSELLKQYAEVEWAEPRFLYEITFDPNDPNYTSQYALSKIKANLAWDITTGDTNVVIGIIDTGVDWTHPDLAANIWHNWSEIPGNSVDDDNNGFVDDNVGWDFGGLTGTPDNNPKEDRPDHGTHVAGIASAVTNNGIGISSIGFKSKIMAVKTSQDNIRTTSGTALISFGYEGIIYAADNHASVINCSWGGGAYSILAQETINYALSKGALVVGASGNNGLNTSFYPASFTGVLSVGATNSSDIKASFTNIGVDVDVMAPGVNIFSTWQTNNYTNSSGTSMAAPLAAGLAALIKARFPNYTPMQVGEQMRVTTDDIYAINPGNDYFLGKGRINAYSALNNNNAKSIRITSYSFSDEAPGGNGNNILEPGETISILINGMNYLAPVSGVSAVLESKNNYSTILVGGFNIPAVGTLQPFNNSSARFSFKLSQTMPYNTELNFIVKFSDGTYNDFQWLQTIGNPDFATQSGNNVALTITSFGALAFNNYSTNTEGDGFFYKLSDNLMFEGALMTGISATRISDAARDNTGNAQNRDFAKDVPFRFRPGYADHIEGETIFNDNNAGTNKLNISVRLKSYNYSNPLYADFILLRYTITNNSTSVLNNFYAGLFIDWDLIEGSGMGDKTQWDDNTKSGYVYNINQTPAYVGAALVSPGGYNFYGIMNDGSDAGINIYDGFTDTEKWQTMSGGVSKPLAGPGDISHVVSGGPYIINPGQSIDAAFIIGGGDNLNQFLSAVTNARSLYGQIITGAEEVTPDKLTFALEQNYPNPFNPTTQINFSIPKKDNVTLKLYDVLGKEVAVLFSGEKEAGVYTYKFNAGNFSSGVYIYKLQTTEFSQSKKLILMK